MAMTMAMTPWLHFGDTDHLLFKTWQPASHAAIAGACLGVFMFSILERCLAAYRRTQEARWRETYGIMDILRPITDKNG